MDCNHSRRVRIPGSKTFVDVPCGHCIACRIAKTREWKLRLMMENKSWKESCFITLTYDDEHLHLSNCGKATLWPDDLTNFFKRTRTNLHRWKYANDSDYRFDYDSYLESKKDDSVLCTPSPPLLKFFACGEYGDEFGRPH